LTDTHSPSKGQSRLRIWAEMIKFSHSVFALPFALMATFLAGRNLPGGRPTLLHVLLIVVCMVAARSVAMTFNRILDAAIDARNPRTQGRPLPAGKLTMAAAWVFLAVAGLTFAVACFSFYFLFQNPWPMLLGGPLLLYLCGYSFTKRFTKYTHFYLGSAIALSPIAAWIAVDPGSLSWPAVLLSAAVTLWIAGFDIIYACQDIEVDRRERLFSIPAKLGPAPALLITRFLHALTIVLLLLVGVTAELGWLHYAGVGTVALLLFLENRAVKPDDFSKVNLAFFTINGVVSLLMGACAIVDVLLGFPRLI